MAKKLTFKRILAMILAIMMLTGIMQLTVFADEADDSWRNYDYETPLNPATAQQDGITVHKTAERTGADTWAVNVTATVGPEQPIQAQPIEIVFVLDKSGSMAWCTDVEAHKAGSHTHTDSCKTLTCTEHEHTSACFTDCNPWSNPDHWDGWTHIGTGCVEYWNGYFNAYHFISCQYPDSNHVHTDDCYELTCGKLECRHTTSNNTPCKFKGDDGEWHNFEPSRLDVAKGALNTLAAALPNNAIVKYVAFSDNAGVVTDLSSVTAKGSTHLTAGVEKGIGQFTNSSVSKKILVVLTDGQSNDGYPTGNSWFENFQGDVFTVGFGVNDTNLQGMVKGSGSYMTADNPQALLDVFDSIKTTITAMIVDPMGPNVSYQGDAANTGIDGSITLSDNTLYWIPNTNTQIVDSTISFTYSVKLIDMGDVGLQAAHATVLNGTTYLQYGLVNSTGTVTDARQLNYNLPVGHYAVGSVQVNWKCGDTDVKTPTAVEKQIVDWTGAAFTTETEIAEADKQIVIPGTNNYYVYTGTTITKDGASADAVAVTPNAYVVTHHYELVQMNLVHYEYETPCPENAPALPEDALYQSSAPADTVEVEDEPTMDEYNFSGWSTDDVDVAEDGSFTMPTKDVTFVGSWTIKPSYQIFANYYTITDDGDPVKDNDAPVALTDVIYTNDESASYTLKDNDYIYGAGGAYALEEGGSDTVDVTPATPTANETFELYRYVKSPANYTVTHVYVDVDPDGKETVNQNLGYTTDPYTGKHGETISAENTTQVPRDDKNGTYTFSMAAPSVVTLDKDVEKNIELTYRHYQYRVTTSGDDGVAALTATAVYDKGENAAVTYSIKDGYEIVTFTVDGAAVTPGTQTFNAIDANHSVAITTKQIDYKLFVQYIFSDGTTHAGFADGRYDNVAYHFDSDWAVEAKEAPAGYTFDADASTNPLSGEKNFGYGDKTVTLKYTKNGDATVTVKYVIDGTETEIKTAYSQSGTIGTDYTIPETEKPASIEFEGKTYDFVSDGNAVYDSTYTQGGTVITRTYAEREKFTVKVLYVSQADRTNIGSQPEVSLYITETHMVTIPATYSPDGSSTWYVDAEDITISTRGNYISAQFGADGTSEPIIRYVDQNNVVDGVATVTVGFYQLPTWTIDATYTTITNGNSSTQTAGDHGTGELGEKVPFIQADYDTKYDFSAENFNEDLKVNGEAVTEMPEMEKFGTYAVTLSYTKTVNNPVDTTIKHTFRTTLNGESIADNTKADDEVFAVTYGQTADMTTHSKAGQTGYEGYTVEAYDPASAQLAAGATGTIQYLREYVTVVFDMNGGTWNDSLNNVEYTVVKGDALATDQPVPAPTRDGYYFVGWDVDVEGATVDGTFTQKTTFTAKWSKVPAVDYTVTHVYLTNGTEDGRTTETFTGTEGETIAAADIKRVTEYAGNNYEFESATADIVLKSGEAKNITLTYTRTYTEPTPPPYYPPVDPTPTPTPDPTEIPEDDVPLSDTPTEIPEDDVPLSDTPVEIPEDDVPLGDLPSTPGFDNTPKTGDNAHYRFWVIVSLLSGLGLIALGFDGRKRSRRTGR